MMVSTCSSNYSGGWGRRITWTWEAQATMSRDHTAAFQPGWQRDKKGKERRRKEGNKPLFCLSQRFNYTNIEHLLVKVCCWFVSTHTRCLHFTLSLKIKFWYLLIFGLNWIIFLNIVRQENRVWRPIHADSLELNRMETLPAMTGTVLSIYKGHTK